MTIFDLLSSLLFTKKVVELNCDEESQFSSFMINRWCSMHSKELANLINETTNVYTGQQFTKQEQYLFYYHLLPKYRFKKLNYIKKVKKEDKEKEKIHIPEFLSQREFKQYVELTDTVHN